jgi:hypothetical protein
MQVVVDGLARDEKGLGISRLRRPSPARRATRSSLGVSAATPRSAVRRGRAPAASSSSRARAASAVAPRVVARSSDHSRGSGPAAGARVAQRRARRARAAARPASARPRASRPPPPAAGSAAGPPRAGRPCKARRRFYGPARLPGRSRAFSSRSASPGPRGGAGNAQFPGRGRGNLFEGELTGGYVVFDGGRLRGTGSFVGVPNVGGEYEGKAQCG